ncbi:MAG: aminotransferase class I/II-fold pyridoxal phosphate-dependent enzyme [Bacteroidota bacterium]|nr:aminotransferase class I/II-fold pyridoxal phosphate-dependent enzyme [Bacteroidota bacterium]
MNFSSENYDKTHPRILKALLKSNNGFVPSYGKDEYTFKAIEKFKEVFGTKELETFFCFNGTGANNFAIGSLTEKHNAVLCSDVSHLYTAESTAPETFTGCRLYPLKTRDGKILIEDLLLKIKTKNDVHLPPASVLTITQPTEYGTIYDRKELKIIAKHCRQNNILLHVDGARLFNALAAMNCSLADFVKISGADALTLGGTKSGLLFGEAVVFFNSKRFKNLHYHHKRSMQLASKNRFIAVQFSELLKDGLWKKIATHTNNLASYFKQELMKTGNAEIAYPVETNMVFMKMGQTQFDKLKSSAHFYRWDFQQEEVRFAFSFSNTKKEINSFFKEYRKAIKGNSLSN